MRQLPGELENVALADSHEVAADGTLSAQAHPDALMLTVRPQAPVQVVLTGHYDTVYPAGTPFTAVTKRADGALNGPGLADMKGGISVMLAALRAFEDHPDKGEVGYRVLLSPDEEIGSLASGPVLAKLAAGGHVTGVIPHALAEQELAHDGLSELIVTESMHERKRTMAERADAFVALPGGLGTLEELLEVWTWTQLGFQSKPCGVLNVEGYYDGLLAFIAHAQAEGYVKPEHRRILYVGTEPGELLEQLQSFQPPRPAWRWAR